MSIKVIIADDHDVVREGIRVIVEEKSQDIEIIGEAADGREVLEMSKNRSADVYIIDLSMPILNGLEVTEKLLKKNPRSKIIILSMHDNRTFLEKAMEYGVKGYVLKENASDEIVQAIHGVYMNRYFLSPKMSKYVIQGFLAKTHHKEQHEEVIDLTAREREILQLIAEGFTNKEIAVQLKLSLNTVHVHRNNIMQKLDIHKQADLIRYALKEGISEL